MLTTKTISEIARLNAEGLNDEEIADVLGMKRCTVHYWRSIKLGLPNTGHYRTAKRFTVYDGKTTQFLVEGTIKEICAALGMAYITFQHAKTAFERGRYYKYEIYEVL